MVCEFYYLIVSVGLAANILLYTTSFKLPVYLVGAHLISWLNAIAHGRILTQSVSDIISALASSP